MSSSNRVWLGIAALLLGCQKEATSEATSRPSDAGAPAKAMDPDLAQAVAAASARVPGTSAGVEGGPPPNGIFAPGAADKEISAGQAPKITLGSEGSEPRVALVPAQPKAGSRQSGTIEITVQNNPQQRGLPIELGVTFEAQKPKAEEGVTNEVPVTVRVTSAKLAVPGAPKELEERIAKLKGAKVEYLVLPHGAGAGYRFDVPKAAGEELGDVVRALSDTLALVTVPFPHKPVGAGAYWMATSRDGMLGLDLVTYRLVKVERVEANKVTLNVNTKRYAASQRFDLPGLPADAPRTLVEFQSLSDGTLEVEQGKGFPGSGKQKSALAAALGNEQAPNGERGMLEVQSRAELRFGAPAR